MNIFNNFFLDKILAKYPLNAASFQDFWREHAPNPSSILNQPPPPPRNEILDTPLYQCIYQFNVKYLVCSLQPLLVREGEGRQYHTDIV